MKPGDACEVIGSIVGPHETELAAALSARRGHARLVRRCGDLAELLGVAEAGCGQVALVSVDRPAQDRLDLEVVARLHADGLVVLAVLDPASAEDEVTALALGVDGVLRAPFEEDTLVAAILTAWARGPVSLPGNQDASLQDGGRTDHYPHRAEGDAVSGDDGRTTSRFGGSGAAAHELPTAGTLVAVWGPPGSPGRTTIAVNIAAELARPPAVRARGTEPAPVPEVLLIDGDTHAPSVAQHLALLDESSGLVLAARAATHGRLTPEFLASVAPVVEPNFRVLTGIGRAARWGEVPASALPKLWAAARQVADVVIVDCAADIEQDESLVYDTRAPQRNAATLGALAAADVIVIVAGCDPVAVQRLVVALDELRGSGVASTTRRVVVLNRARGAVAGGRPSAVLRDALVRFAGTSPDVIVADDAPAADAALLAGRTFAEEAPGSVARRGILEVVRALRLTPAGSAQHDGGQGPSAPTGEGSTRAGSRGVRAGWLARMRVASRPGARATASSSAVVD